MNTGLKPLLGEIEPIPDRIDRLVDQAVNTFTWQVARFTHGDEYTAWLAALYCHLESCVLGIGTRAVHACIDLSRAWDLLKKRYGENAPQTIYDIARSGSEGGLRQIMLSMADSYSHEYARNMISLTVGFYLKGRSPATLLEAAREYVRLFPHVVPAELAEGTPARIMANFPSVLEMHPFLIRRVRETGR